jgi:hypothetical protein
MNSCQPSPPANANKIAYTEQWYQLGFFGCESPDGLGAWLKSTCPASNEAEFKLQYHHQKNKNKKKNHQIYWMITGSRAYTSKINEFQLVYPLCSSASGANSLEEHVIGPS